MHFILITFIYYFISFTAFSQNVVGHSFDINRSISFKNKLKYNLYLWYFGLTKVRLIHFIRPKIIDVNKEGVTLFMPLDRRTRNHVRSMYIGAMVVGVDFFCTGR